LRNRAPNDGDGNAEHGLTVRPSAGKLSSDARVVYEIVLRFTPIYAGRILKGAKPVELPVIQSSKFELVVHVSSSCR
jgi:putative tryptophan/tyrosine transport system substrate-binding protein